MGRRQASLVPVQDIVPTQYKTVQEIVQKWFGEKYKMF